MGKSFLVMVTNDLNQDQRMHRICDTLAAAGHRVLLIGRNKHDSKPLLSHKFQQQRLNCFFSKGIWFYLEFNLRLLLFALRYRPEVVYAVDLDTLFAGGVTAKILKSKLIHDAHEYFVEVPELVGKQFKKWIWNRIGKQFIPDCDLCITVNNELAEVLTRLYRNDFKVIRSVPSLGKYTKPESRKEDKKIILYQGVLNKGRGLEEAIFAMEGLPKEYELRIAGEGDLSIRLRKIAVSFSAENRIKFLGWLNPEALREETLKADVGLNLLSAQSLNYKYSLANKFFDYMHAGVPSVNMDFPVYRRICAAYPVGVCIQSLKKSHIQNAILALTADQKNMAKIKAACQEAKSEYNWESEAKKLLRWIDKSIGNTNIRKL